MNRLTLITFIGSILMLSILVIGGCSKKPINTELQLNHPANPAAEESVFIKPPDPFALEATYTEPQESPSTSSLPKKHQEDTGHRHDMQIMKHDSNSLNDRKVENSTHKH